MKKYILSTGLTLLVLIQIIAFAAVPSAAKSNSAPALVGCFANASPMGDLTLSSAVNTLSECANAARSASARVFALQGGTRCFLGNNFPGGGPSVSCEPCRDNPQAMCKTGDDANHSLVVYKFSLTTPITSTAIKSNAIMQQETQTTRKATTTKTITRIVIETPGGKPVKTITTPEPARPNSATVTVWKTKTTTSTERQ